MEIKWNVEDRIIKDFGLVKKNEIYDMKEDLAKQCISQKLAKSTKKKDKDK